MTTLPWVIKPVYGFLTDGLPIFGLRRKPYLVIGGLLGSAAWASLATVVETPTQVRPLRARRRDRESDSSGTAPALRDH